MVTQLEPVQNSKQLTVVLYITNDNAGAAMAFIWAVVMRGTSNPLVVELMSRTADAFGAAPVLFIPMFCAQSAFDSVKYRARINNPVLTYWKANFIR
jgi:hypothetical protein